jgi:hypothetical protein
MDDFDAISGVFLEAPVVMRMCLFDPRTHGSKARTTLCESSASGNGHGCVTAVDGERIHSDPLTEARCQVFKWW